MLLTCSRPTWLAGAEFVGTLTPTRRGGYPRIARGTTADLSPQVLQSSRFNRERVTESSRIRRVLTLSADLPDFGRPPSEVTAPMARQRSAKCSDTARTPRYSRIHGTTMPPPSAPNSIL